MFTAHDAGHRAITHIFVVDTLIGMFIADFCCGLSIGWWKSSHNVHHLITNQPVSPALRNLHSLLVLEHVLTVLFSGTRPRHPERPSLRYVSRLFQVDSF
jgi:delta8-fatty-acid desaturase